MEEPVKEAGSQDVAANSPEEENPNSGELKNVHSGHRGRLRKKYLSTGFDEMMPHEALEFLLFFPIKLRDTNNLAHEIIDRCGGFEKVFTADAEVIAGVSGAGLNTAAFLKGIYAIYRMYGGVTDSPASRLSSKLSATLYYDKVFSDRPLNALHISAVNPDLEVMYAFRIDDPEPGDVTCIASECASTIFYGIHRSCAVAQYRPRITDIDLKFAMGLVKRLRAVGITVRAYFMIDETGMYDAIAEKRIIE